MTQMRESSVGVYLTAALAVRILQLQVLSMPVKLPQGEEIRSGRALVSVAARAIC
jgi:hypothetical protein